MAVTHRTQKDFCQEACNDMVFWTSPEKLMGLDIPTAPKCTNNHPIIAVAQKIPTKLKRTNGSQIYLSQNLPKGRQLCLHLIHKEFFLFKTSYT